MAAGDSGDSALGAGQAAQAARPPPGCHPFFAPLAAKRAGATTCGNDDTAAAAAAGADPKRQKQCASAPPAEKRARRPKAPGRVSPRPSAGKPATIQSFFGARPAIAGGSGQPRADDATEYPISGQLACGAGLGSDVASASTRGGTSTMDTAVAAAWSPRRARQPARTPAPFPEDSHVPAPVYRAFAPAACAEGARARVPYAHNLHATRMMSALETYAADRPHASDDDSGFIWRALARENADQQQPRLRALALSDTGCSAAQPVLVAFASGLPRAPPHLQFLEPLLDRLHGKAPCDQRQNAGLLAARHRPRRVRDLLDNRRAAAQLQSWIEGMRLRRAIAPAAGDHHGDYAAGRAPRPRLRCGPARASDPQAKSKRTARCHAQKPKASTGSSSSSSDDDFMPTGGRHRSRSSRDADALGAVLAWAQSDGSLTSVREKMRAAPRHGRRGGGESGASSSSEAESFSNIILLVGPSGSCKTATVYACADECGFEVHEIHPGQRRSGKDVLAALEAAILSHTISIPAAGAHAAEKAAVSQMLVLIEHADILFEQDQRLWPALRQLALRSRRPIVLTCNDTSCISWDSGRFHSVLQFSRPGEHALVPYCFLLCLSEGVLAAPADLARACREAGCDVNRVLSQLDFALRRPAVHVEAGPAGGSAEASTLIAATGADPRRADLGGTLAWLAGPLKDGEAPQTRYRLWLEIVALAQTPSSDGWFDRWPDPPPAPSPPPRLASLTREIRYSAPRTPAASQNTFFCPAAGAATGRESVEPAAPPGRPPTAPLLWATPLAIAAAPFSAQGAAAYGSRQSPQQPQSNCSDVRSDCAADLALLDAAAAALDMLSLVGATDSQAIAQECLYEPLYSHLAPMADGCLGVSYVVLDAGTHGRRNPTLPPDSIGAEQRTGARIREHLRTAAAGRLGALPGLELPGDYVDACLAPRGIARPQPSPAQGPAARCETVHRMREAAAFAGHLVQRGGPLQLADTVAFLARMVAWDWIHQGKLAPSRSAAREDAHGDGADHAYRVGQRRTRQQTYRAHIKHLPPPLQVFLVSRPGPQ
ncbi:hypothetical protein LPJ61_003431 [Coemansia biformis]|uniref:AAA+ ATPase domain-containing protein n=1 Tax=Coemansia biformis TaxID=1286918 RepID=A0A9W7YBE6_9FUNG|nr:hypothetical protein LPJ61_003431 [Coemansia biformis]